MVDTTGVIVWVTKRLCNVVILVAIHVLYLLNIAVKIKQFFVWVNISVTITVFVFSGPVDKRITVLWQLSLLLCECYLHLHLQWLPTRSYNGHSVGGRSGLIYMVSLVLNSSVLLMSSTAGGSLFHSRMVRGQKLFLYSSQLLWIVRNFMGWDPLVLRSGLWVT